MLAVACSRAAAALAPASAWALRLASWVSSISAMVLVLVVSMVARLFGGLSRAEAPGDGLDGVRVQGGGDAAIEAGEAGDVFCLGHPGGAEWADEVDAFVDGIPG